MIPGARAERDYSGREVVHDRIPRSFGNNGSPANPGRCVRVLDAALAGVVDPLAVELQRPFN